MPNKIEFKEIKGGKSSHPLAEVLEEAMSGLQFQLKLYEVIAKHRKKYFDELIKEGFTEQQAMEIVKTTNI